MTRLLARLGAPARAAGRGFARPALWAHYADAHHGICLILDRSEFARRVHAKFAGSGAARDVTYVEGIDTSDASGVLDLDVVAVRGTSVAVRAHLRRHLEKLVFTKNSDWSPEREWRCCVLGQPAGDVDIELDGGVLCGIVTGLDVQDSDLDAVQYVCDEFHIRHNVAGTYLHQLNMIDVRPIDTSSSPWTYAS